MAIPAKRFNFLSDETNVATSDLRTLTSRQILNTDLVETLGSLLDGDLGSIFGILDGVFGSIDIGAILDTLGIVGDIGDLDDAVIDEIISQFSGGDPIFAAKIKAYLNSCGISLGDWLNYNNKKYNYNLNFDPCDPQNIGNFLTGGGSYDDNQNYDDVINDTILRIGVGRNGEIPEGIDTRIGEYDQPASIIVKCPDENDDTNTSPSPNQDVSWSKISACLVDCYTFPTGCVPIARHMPIFFSDLDRSFKSGNIADAKNKLTSLVNAFGSVNRHELCQEGYRTSDPNNEYWNSSLASSDPSALYKYFKHYGQFKYALVR